MDWQEQKLEELLGFLLFFQTSLPLALTAWNISNIFVFTSTGGKSKLIPYVKWRDS